MNTKKLKISLSIIISLLISSFPVYAQDTGNLYDDVLEEDNSGYQQPQGYDAQQYEQQPQQQGYGQGQPQYYGQNRPLMGSVVIVPVGTSFNARLEIGISTGLNNVGDVVRANLSSPVVVGNQVVIPAGSSVIGTITDLKSARFFMGGAGGEMEITFTSVQLPNGQSYPLSANVDQTRFRLKAESGGTRVAKGVAKTAVGAGAGALAGLIGAAISGGEKGKAAAIGSGIGAGVGATTALAGKGKELELPAGTELPINLTQALRAIVP